MTTRRAQDQNLQAIIFDMDGLMVDTEPLSRQAWDRALVPYGVKLDDATYGRMIGLRIDVSVNLVITTYNLPVEPGVLARSRDAFLAEIRALGIPVMPGLFRLVRAVDERQIPWAVATSNWRVMAEENLTQLGLLARCRAIAAGDEVSQGKPAPDIYLLAARRLAVDPGRCLALEDSVPGARAARAAGMITLAVPNGQSKPVDFPFVDYIFSSLNDVADNLDRLFSA